MRHSTSARLIFAGSLLLCAPSLAQEISEDALDAALEGSAKPEDATETEDLADLDLDELLNREVGVGKAGSFGYRLGGGDANDVYVHGFAVAELYRRSPAPFTFNLKYFNLIVGANLSDRVIPELQLEYETGGDSIVVRYGQLDLIVLGENLIVRVGKFLTPFGYYNEYLYPEFLARTADRPFVMEDLVPVTWAEVGAQVRGRWSWSKGNAINYAIYAVNGLEQADDPATPEVEDGGDIRDFRDNHLDLNNGSKSFGGRLGLELFEDISLGGSVYVGPYTVDGEQIILLHGADVRYAGDALTLEAEFARSTETVAQGADVRKYGVYMLGAYQVLNWLEPVVMWDMLHLINDEKLKMRVTGGLNLRPYPESIPTLVFKANYQALWGLDDGYANGRNQEELGSRIIFQLAAGF